MNRLDKLKGKIGNTSIVEITNKKIPNGNRIFAKLEYENPTGSHYDRIYFELFSFLEEKGKITRGKSKLIEVSSGTAAISFAWFCKQLGYESKVVLPNRMIKSYFEEFINSNTEVIISDKNQYILGAVSYLKVYLEGHPGYFCLNHSRQPISLRGTYKIGAEISQYFYDNNLSPDYFIPACGNGLSLIGPGRWLKDSFPKIKIITYENKNAPVAYKRKFPELYLKKFGENFKCSPHHLFGTSAWGVDFPFIIEEKYGFMKIVDDVSLIVDMEWFSVDDELKELGYDVGSTSLAAYLTAKKIAKEVSNKIFIVIFYDKRSKYF